jgi:hypothetical protein
MGKKGPMAFNLNQIDLKAQADEFSNQVFHQPVHTAVSGRGQKNGNLMLNQNHFLNIFFGNAIQKIWNNKRFNIYIVGRSNCLLYMLFSWDSKKN